MSDSTSTTKAATKATKPRKVAFSHGVVLFAKATKQSDVTKAGKALRARLRADARNAKLPAAQRKALKRFMGEKVAGDGNRWPDIPVTLLKHYCK